MSKRKNTVAVLEDGDNTTWSGDAFLIHVTDEEYTEIADGDDKMMRRLASEGRPTYSAERMFECIRQINKTLRRSSEEDDPTGATLGVVRGDLQAYGFLDDE